MFCLQGRHKESDNCTVQNLIIQSISVRAEDNISINICFTVWCFMHTNYFDPFTSSLLYVLDIVLYVLDIVLYVLDIVLYVLDIVLYMLDILLYGSDISLYVLDILWYRSDILLCIMFTIDCYV